MANSIILFTSYGLLLLLLYVIGLKKARTLAHVPINDENVNQWRNLNSKPYYYSTFVILLALISSIVVFGTLKLFERSYIKAQITSQLTDTSEEKRDLLFDKIQRIATSAHNEETVSAQLTELIESYKKQKGTFSFGILCTTFGTLLLSGFLGLRCIHERFRARIAVESIVRSLLAGCAFVAVLTTLGILASLIFEGFRFFQLVHPIDFLFGLHWNPQTAMRADQVASEGAFGAIPVFAGTLLIATIAMLVAVPVGLFSALYLAEYATARVRNIVKPLLEILAGIPTVVYGFFAALTVAPYIVEGTSLLGLSASSESALAAGLVMGIMIIPFISSLSDDIIYAVPQQLRQASYGLGATQSETIRKVVLPAALPGIAGAILLALSRAIGETMIVVMAAGLAAKLTLNPLENVTTVTVQIVSTLIGDQEFNSPKTLSAFALGLTLFVVTLFFNVISLLLVKRYREIYE